MAKKPGLGIVVKDRGIATILHHMQLMVPPNQRSYAWTDSHVRTLYEDLSSAISKGNEAYFLGTIVLTQGTADRLEVADGQQRLATTSILIAAIRDHLEIEGGVAEKKAANTLTGDFLLKYELKSGENIPKLQLNYEDNEYFSRRILLGPNESEREKIKPTTLSHERLKRAAEIAKEHIENIISQFAKAERFKRLYDWIEFLQNNVLVIEIQVPEDINAFTMFETLNDRGLRASQTDILKNTLFALAAGKVTEVQVKWASMTATIDSIGDADLLLAYLRHYWSTRQGYVVERELATKIKEQITNRQQAINFIAELEDFAGDYVGLLGPLEYMGWSNLDQKPRANIYILTRILKIEQIRPLLLAIVRNFGPNHAKEALKMLVSWSVRFLVAGTGGGGPLDRAYMQAAKDVMEGTIKTAKQLKDKVGSVITRSDKDFKEAFAKARATKNDLARYYLRALEQYERNLKSPGVDAEPELGGVLDRSDSFNLEHVMPQSISDEWNKITAEIAQQYAKRLGNMALLNPGSNVKLGNRSFAEKKEVYKNSPQLLTQSISDYSDWGPDQIDDRQAQLAELAVRIWDQ